MTKNDFLEILKFINEKYEDFNWENCIEDSFEGYEKYFKKFNRKLAYVDHYGGEDQGSDYWTVFSVTDLNTKNVTYFKLDGWYASYDGHTWKDAFDFYEVKKVPVQTYEWQSVNE